MLLQGGSALTQKKEHTHPIREARKILTLALVLALLAALYALTQRWLSTRGVRRFESIR